MKRAYSSILIISTLICFLPLTLHAKGVEFFTSIHIKEKIRSIKDNEYKKIFLFADKNQCSLCVNSVNNILSVIDTSKAKIYIFVDEDDAESSGIIQNNLSKSQVIIDYAGAYKNLYKIKHAPVLLLTDENNAVDFIGIPGKAGLFDSDKFIELLMKPSNKARSQNLILKEEHVLYNDSSVITDDVFRNVSFIEGDSLFAAMNFYLKTLYVFNTNGKCLKSVNLADRINNLHAPILFNGNLTKSRILLMAIVKPLSYKYYNYNYEIDSLQFLMETKENDSTYPCINNYYIDDKNIIQTVNYNFSNRGKINRENIRSLVTYDIQGTIKTQYSFLETHSCKYNLHAFYTNALCTDVNGNLYQLQSFSDTLRVFDSTYKFIQSIPVHFDSTFFWYEWKRQIPTAKMDNITTLLQLDDSLTLVSDMKGILVDDISNTVYVLYQKKKLSESGQKYLQFYINRVGEKRVRDIELPQLSFPFCIKDNCLYCIVKKNDMLYFTKYLLKFTEL